MSASALSTPALIQPRSHADMLALPPASQIAFRLFLLLSTWERRARTRRELSRVPTERLADIGLSATRAEDEAAKPFWQG